MAEFTRLDPNADNVWVVIPVMPDAGIAVTKLKNGAIIIETDDPPKGNKPGVLRQAVVAHAEVRRGLNALRTCHRLNKWAYYFKSNALATRRGTSVRRWEVGQLHVQVNSRSAADQLIAALEKALKYEAE